MKSLLTFIFALCLCVSALAQRPSEINVVQTDTNLPAGASASSTYSANFPVPAAVNGDTSGVGWGSGFYVNGNGWNSGNSERYGTSTYTVMFGRTYLLKEIVTWGLKNDFGSAREPLEGETSVYANRNFKIQVLQPDGFSWSDVPGASVANNQLVINHFPLIQEGILTKGVRVVFDGSMGGDGFARLIEIKAYAKQ